MYYWNDFIIDINSTIRQNDTVLDAGAGDGHWRYLLPNHINYISMDMGVGDNTVDYSFLDIKGDLREIPLEDNSIDIIISIQVLEHLPEPWLVLQEFNRILKPGGTLFFSCPQGEYQHQVPYDFYRYTIFGIRSLLSGSNFVEEWIKPQKGNISKISNDYVHTIEKIKDASSIWPLVVLNKLFYYYLKIIWRLNEKILLKFDHLPGFQDNTTGFFVKAKKPGLINP